MKKTAFMVSVLMLSSLQSFAANAPTGHPWLDKQLKKDRYPCPPGDSPFKGPADAQVKITEFIDYDCPFCSQQEGTMKKVLAAYPTQVKLVIKNLPLDIHPKAKQKAIVAECMHSQGKFWQAHERFLSGDKKVREGADQAKINACLERGGDGQVEKDIALAKKLGLASTPSFVIDGIRQGGTIGFEQFKLLIDAELARKAAKAEAKSDGQKDAPATDGN